MHFVLSGIHLSQLDHKILIWNAKFFNKIIIYYYWKNRNKYKNNEKYLIKK